MQQPLKVLITTGPTREYIDDVRYLTNVSTGRMGIELARACQREGWEPTLIAGPITEALPVGVTTIPIVSAQDLYDEVRRHMPDHDVFIAAAAVADYRPRTRVEGKLKKSSTTLSLELEQTPDTLAWVGTHRLPHQIVVGFALEADPNPQLAEDKRRRKGCHLLVHNSPENFGSGGGHVRILAESGVVWEGSASKPALATQILQQVRALLRG